MEFQVLEESNCHLFAIRRPTSTPLSIKNPFKNKSNQRKIISTTDQPGTWKPDDRASLSTNFTLKEPSTITAQGAWEFRDSCLTPCSMFCRKYLIASTASVSVVDFLCIGQVDPVKGFYNSTSKLFEVVLVTYVWSIPCGNAMVLSWRSCEH